jgi:hypothetical protein
MHICFYALSHVQILSVNLSANSNSQTIAKLIDTLSVTHLHFFGTYSSHHISVIIFKKVWGTTRCFPTTVQF